MAYQYSTTLRDNQLAQILATIGTSGATLVIYGGTTAPSEPANCAATATGSVLATIDLPASPMGTPSAGSVSMSGTWSATASATGLAGYFRILDSSSNVHVQGNVTSDLVLNNTSITSGQTVSVSQFTVNAGNS